MKKHSKTLIVKILLDVVMLVLLLMLYQKRSISMAFHEIAGLVLFGMFLVHKLLNRKWIRNVTLKLFRKSTSARLRVSWAVDFLLLLSMTGIILTGLMMSKTLPFRLGSWAGAQQWHYFLAAASIILMGVHLGLHWSFIKGVCAKHALLPKRLAATLGVLILVAALGWGGYTLATGSFVRWISMPFASPAGAFHGEGHAFPEMPTGDAFPEMPSDADGTASIPDIPADEEMQAPSADGQHAEGEAQGRTPGKGLGKGKGLGNGMGQGRNRNADLSILNLLNVIATYASQMCVFAFLTALLARRKKGLQK